MPARHEEPGVERWMILFQLFLYLYTHNILYWHSKFCPHNYLFFSLCDSRIKGFRYPSPGSRPAAKVPSRTEDELYNTNHYSKDPRNLPDETQIFINSAKRPTLIEPGKNAKVGSPGLNFAMMGDSEVDPLRFTTKTTYAARDVSVLEHAKPNHNVRYAWEGEMEAVWAECERKGIPYAIGKRYKFKTTPVNYNDVEW